MTTDFYDTLGTIASYSLSIGDKIIGEVPEKNQLGFQILREKRQYEVSGNPANRYFTVGHHVRFTSDITRVLENNHGKLKSLLDRYAIDSPEVSDDELASVAARHHVEDLPEEEINNMIHSLNQYISQTQCRREWLFADEQKAVWDGMLVKYQIYPYEEDFSVSEYDKAVQTTLNVVSRARNHLQQELDIFDFESGLDD